MKRLVAASPRGDGARVQRRIADGYNSFGPSDHYVSVYRGWLTIPAAGRYEFCTASNEASFSFIDGKDLVHWPGRHTEERGMRGEKNAAVELAAGLHYIEYYHEEVTLTQMAFLGWKPPGAAAFDAIPESQFPAPLDAAVTRYETSAGPVATFQPTIVSSIWPAPAVRSEGQYTACRYTAAAADAFPAGTTFRWEFGDGQAATGPQVEHVYLATGSYRVTLSADGPAGKSQAVWPLDVYEIEHVTAEFAEGRLADYLALARGYDRSKLDRGSLRELVHLVSEAGDPAEAVAVGRDYLARESSSPSESARMHRLVAENLIRQGAGSLDDAIASFEKSISDAMPVEERLDVLARLVRLLGIDRNLPERAGTVLARIEETMKGARRTPEVLAAYRRALIAGGDVLLWQNQRNGARSLYQRAELLTEAVVPPPVRAARIGAYPNALRDLIDSQNYSAALQIVSRWQEEFPIEKLRGDTFFWYGKLLVLRGQHRDAIGHLQRAVALAPGADYESEARWLLAGSLEATGKATDARREWLRLVATGIADEFTERARKKLGQ
jgi:tetratricopeptide (TPR) repeat protein